MNIEPQKNDDLSQKPNGSQMDSHNLNLRVLLFWTHGGPLNYGNWL